MSQKLLPDMMFSIAFLLLIVTPILSVFLRLAIVLANRIIGPQRPFNDSALIEIPSMARLPSDDSNPYAPPKMVSVAVERDRAAAIPMPKLWSAFGIVVIAEMLGSVLFFASILSALSGSPFLPQLLGLAVSFFIPVFTYALLLPTSFRRAALVFLIQFTMAIVFFGAILAAAWLV